jgi:hypothetical protein
MNTIPITKHRIVIFSNLSIFAPPFSITAEHTYISHTKHCLTLLFLFIFHGLFQFSDAEFEPFYLSTDINFVEHLPVLGFTENTNLYAADKDSGIHDLELSLVCIEEFDAAKDNPNHKRQRV